MRVRISSYDGPAGIGFRRRLDPEHIDGGLETLGDLGRLGRGDLRRVVDAIGEQNRRAPVMIGLLHRLRNPSHHVIKRGRAPRFDGLEHPRQEVPAHAEGKSFEDLVVAEGPQRELVFLSSFAEKGHDQVPAAVELAPGHGTRGVEDETETDGKVVLEVEIADGHRVAIDEEVELVLAPRP